jgi:hypothetical protein
MTMPSQRIKASDVTEHLRDRIRSAEEIWLVDPRRDDKHPWMELIVSVPPPIPDVVDPSAPQSDPAILEIEVDSTKQEELVQIREQIKTLCGPGMDPPAAV